MSVAMASRRTRKSPQARREEILDSVARMVLEEGVSAVSMERVGRAAGISKALVYNYFPGRDDVLAALLKREQTELRERGFGAATKARNVSELIRATTRIFLEQVERRGALIQSLLADPSVAKLMEQDMRDERERARKFFIRQIAKAYGLSNSVAATGVDLLWAITDEAGRMLARGVLSREDAEFMAVTLITGGLEKLAREV